MLENRQGQGSGDKDKDVKDRETERQRGATEEYRLQRLSELAKFSKFE
jgi:hypothetical protein